MIKLIYFLCFAAGAVSVLGAECDKLGILIYEDLGCTAEYGEDKQCPIKYSCKGLESSEKKCYFRGKSYENNEAVDSSLSYPSCQISCSCTVRNGRSDFTCAILDCPEWLGVHPPFGCYRNYSVDECCSVGEICHPYVSEKCVVDGKEYVEGVRFYPANTCLGCVCQKGFNGKFEEPFCKRQSCGHQLRNFGSQIQRSCAPFYSKAWQTEILCCPDDWICPDGTEVIQGDTKSEKVCKFGNSSLKVGQHLEKLNIRDTYGRSFKRIKCECVIPPLLKCIDL